MLCGPMDCIRMVVDRAWNQGDLKAIDELYSPHVIQYDVSSGVADHVGLAGQKKQILALRGAFPDLHVVAEEIIGSGHKVVARLTFSGTHKGDWMGVAPTNRHVTWGGIVIYRFVSNQIQEAWMAEDLYGAVHQLGTHPARQAA
jgi:predicted ester cyclase